MTLISPRATYWLPATKRLRCGRRLPMTRSGHGRQPSAGTNGGPLIELATAKYRSLSIHRTRCAEAPAAGLHGVAIKLAIWQYVSLDHLEFEDHAAALSAYQTLARLAGVDPVAELPNRQGPGLAPGPFAANLSGVAHANRAAHTNLRASSSQQPWGSEEPSSQPTLVRL